MKNLSVKIPDSFFSKLEMYGQHWSMKKSEVVRRAIEEYLSKTDASTSESFLGLAIDLAGCLEGPSDLSSNSKHMDGYGK